MQETRNDAEAQAYEEALRLHEDERGYSPYASLLQQHRRSFNVAVHRVLLQGVQAERGPSHFTSLVDLRVAAEHLRRSFTDTGNLAPWSSSSSSWSPNIIDMAQRFLEDVRGSKEHQNLILASKAYSTLETFAQRQFPRLYESVCGSATTFSEPFDETNVGARQHTAANAVRRAPEYVQVAV